MKKTESIMTGKSFATAMGVGTIVCTMVMLLCVSLITVLMLNETVRPDEVRYWILGTLLLSTVSGCAAATAVSGRQILFVSIGTGISYYLILLSITALFFGGQFSGAGVTLFVVIGSALSVSLIASRRYRKVKPYRKKR